VNETETCPNCGTQLYGLVTRCFKCGATVDIGAKRRAERERTRAERACRRSTGRFRRALPWVAAIAIGVGFATYHFVTSQPLDIDDAVHRAYVTVSITPLAPDPQRSLGYSPPRARIRVTKSNLAPADFTVVIPAGTLIANADPGSQRLMTLAPLTVHLSNGAPSLAQVTDLLCIDQFADAPTSTSHLVLAAPDPGAPILEETEPIRKLNDCLQSKTYGEATVQLAIWLAAGHYLDESYSHVQTALINGYRRSMRAKLKNIPLAVPAGVQQDAPDVDPATLQATYTLYRTTKVAALVEHYAQAEAEFDLGAYVGEAGNALSECGYDVRDAELIRTAPKRAGAG
jgi:hypothetical protein